MDLRKFHIDIDPDGEPLPATCGPKQLIEIERRCGPVSGIACRFVDVNASFVECAHIAEVLLSAGDETSHPSRAEIERWIIELGVSEAITRLNPFMTRVMLGSSVEIED